MWQVPPFAQGKLMQALMGISQFWPWWRRKDTQPVDGNNSNFQTKTCKLKGSLTHNQQFFSLHSPGGVISTNSFSQMVFVYILKLVPAPNGKMNSLLMTEKKYYCWVLRWSAVVPPTTTGTEVLEWDGGMLCSNHISQTALYCETTITTTTPTEKHHNILLWCSLPWAGPDKWS